MLPNFDLGLAAELDVQIGNGNGNGDTASRVAFMKNLPRVLKVPFCMSPPFAGTFALCIGEGPQQGRRWTVRRMTASAAYPLGAVLPSNTTGTISANQAGVGAASAIVLTVPAVAGQVNQVSSFTVSGSGATAGSTIVITLAGVQGGTQSFDYVVPAGAGAAAPTLELNFNPPLQASGANVAIVLTVPSFGAGNLSSAAELEAQTVISTGALNMYLMAESNALGGNFSPSNVSATQLLWQWGAVPTGDTVLPILETWGDDEVTLFYPENAIFVVNTAAAISIAGQLQVIDEPAYADYSPGMASDTLVQLTS